MEEKRITCRAAVLWKEGQPLTIETIEVDPPKEGEVRVKMVAAGLCATDAHFIWNWSTDLAIDLEDHPVVLGHEGAGVVESIGSGVTSVGVGDHVILMWLPQCDNCRFCKNPKTNICVEGDFGSLLYHKNRETRMSVNGRPLLSFAGTSTFSEYSVIRETQLAKVEFTADLKTQCIIGCAVGTGYGSASNIARVHEGATCAVWGLGAIGLSAVIGCRASKAKSIIGIDINGDKEEMAKQLGCTLFLNPKTLKQPVEEVLQGFGGIDYAFDCIGNRLVLETALKSLTSWGSLTVVGLGPRGNHVQVSVKELLEGRSVAGGYFGGAKPRTWNQELSSLHSCGKLPIDGLITSRIRLEDINSGFDGLKAGKTIRTVIEF